MRGPVGSWGADADPTRARKITAPVESSAIRELWTEVNDQVELVVRWRDGVELAPLREGVPCVVGRSEPSDLRIRDTALSRGHARFTWQEDSVLVEDLRSASDAIPDVDPRRGGQSTYLLLC